MSTASVEPAGNVSVAEATADAGDVNIAEDGTTVARKIAYGA
jgi:hypothetical protein